MMLIERPAWKMQSILASLVLCFHLINGALGISGASILMIGLILGLSFLATINRTFDWYARGVVSIILILFAFIASFALVDSSYHTRHYFMYFLGFGIISMMIGMQPVIIQEVASLNVYIGFFCLLAYTVRGFGDPNQFMGNAYAMFPVLISSIIAFRYRGRIRILSALNVGLALNAYVKIAPRGVWLTLGIFVALILYQKVTSSENWRITYIKRLLLIALAIIAIVILATDFNEIILGIRNYLQEKFNITIRALEKFLFLSEQDNVSNGRDALWESAISLIKNSAGIGYGIGYYETINGVHTHNILLQALCEGGIIFFVPILMMLLKSLWFILFPTRGVSDEALQYFVMITCTGIVYLFYSSVYWYWIPFWFYAGMILSQNMIVERK